MTEHESPIEKLQQQLVATISKLKRVVIAFSGGVDSAVVAQAAYLALGDHATAIMSVSPSLAAGELESAQQVANVIGIKFRTIQTLEYLDPNYLQNSTKRCYYCKSALYSSIQVLKDELQFDAILNGANADDQGDYRPGMLAATEFQVLSPLLELGITKSDVRLLAHSWGLPIWNKPATPCLASRIAYGVEVSIPGLKRVDLAEAYLKQTFKLNDLRVRDLGENQARIELPSPATILNERETHQHELMKYFHSLGFEHVVINLEPLQSGSMNKHRQPLTKVLK